MSSVFVKIRKRAVVLGIILLPVLGLPGCGDSGPEIVPVTGKILMNGEPVTNASVTFFATSGRPSYGTSDAEGKYTLEYSHDVQGAIVGDHKVVITKSGIGPPPVEATAEPSTRRVLPPRKTVDSGPMEITLPDLVKVTADMETLDLVIP